MLEILIRIKNTEVTFLVAGRDINGVFKVHKLKPFIQSLYTSCFLWRINLDALSSTPLFLMVLIIQVLEDIDIPQELRDMFIPIPADKFRMDISSTQIRKQLGI